MPKGGKRPGAGRPIGTGTGKTQWRRVMVRLSPDEYQRLVSEVKTDETIHGTIKRWILERITPAPD